MIARGAASVILAGALLLGTTGCTFFSVQATQVPYEPSDGVAANVGGIALRNVIALSADGTDVALVMTIVNNDSNGTFVNLQYSAGDSERRTERVYVAGNSSTSIGNVDDDKLILTDVNAEVGGLLPLYAQVGKTPGVELLVPVLDDTLPEYAQLLPPVASPLAARGYASKR